MWLVIHAPAALFGRNRRDMSEASSELVRIPLQDREAAHEAGQAYGDDQASANLQHQAGRSFSSRLPSGCCADSPNHARGRSTTISSLPRLTCCGDSHGDWRAQDTTIPSLFKPIRRLSSHRCSCDIFCFPAKIETLPFRACPSYVHDLAQACLRPRHVEQNHGMPT